MERCTLTLRVHALLTLAALALGGWAQASGLHGCASHGAGEPAAYHAGTAARDASPGSYHPGAAEQDAAQVAHDATSSAAQLAHHAASHAHSGTPPVAVVADAGHHGCLGHPANDRASIPAHHACAGHGAHAGLAPAHHAPAGGHHGECTCLGDCQAGAGISLPTYVAATAPVATESTLTTAVEGDDAAPLRRAAYLIPFATAPPSLA